MKQKIIIAIAMSWIIALTWCSLIPQTENWQNETPNPASVFCEENGGILEIIPDEWGTRINCNFDDWSFCEERAYYHGECSPWRWNGNTIELQEIEEVQNDENLSQEEKEEISDLIEEIQEHDEISEQNVTCPTDIKQCDDGTYVSRWWPNCEFWSCPWYEINENTINETLQKYESSWSNLQESDIELMNEIIDLVSQN